MMSALAPSHYPETPWHEDHAANAAAQFDLEADLNRWENEGGRAIALESGETTIEEQ
jgi:antibiotic biosynthesis monooxygenase (ABM) superfamily enzyme